MDTTGADDGKKRRLPPWMLGGVGAPPPPPPAPARQVKDKKNDHKVAIASCAALPNSRKRSKNIDKEILHEDEDAPANDFGLPKSKKRSRTMNKEIFLHEDEQVEAPACEDHPPKSKRRSKIVGNETRHEDEEAQVDFSSVSVKYGASKRERKSTLEIADSGNILFHELANKRSTPQREKRVNSRMLTRKEVSLSSADNGNELRMEDLISIAEEYVNADTQRQLLTVGACDSEEKNSASDASNDECASSLDATKRNCISTVLETKSPSSTSIEELQNHSNVDNTSSTGDAALDMLNIFLGTKVVKPTEESKKTANTSIDNFLFDIAVRNQSRNDIVEKLASPLKKKSSLKDKVAMFLD